MRPAPFSSPLLHLVSVSISGGLTFSGRVTVAVGADESTIMDTDAGCVPTVETCTDVLVVPVSGWDSPFPGPSVGDTWVFTEPPTQIAPVAPATGFVSGTGLIVA